MLFQRIEDKFISSVSMFQMSNNQMIVYNKAIAQFNKVDKKAICKYFSETKEKWIENGDEINLRTPIRRNTYSIINSKLSFSVLNDNDFFLKYDKMTNIITLNSDYSRNIKFEQIEKIQVIDFESKIKATQDSIGMCLTEWGLGSGYLEDDNELNFTTEIHTNKHSYIFTLTNWNNDKILYCRAAKIKSNNKGSVFVQNIRLMRNSNEFTARMAENNLIASKENIVIKNQLFDPDKCVFINGGEEIYWSLKDFSQDEIILNGCAGEEYKYSRPKTENDDYEYFKYES
ncbi:MAG: hypothetical protein ISS38_03270 [Candidatus Cloacimonetes bacterium]|nr:hypothetical protein [Candidatus Cloacimonadota bacterium]